MAQPVLAAPQHTVQSGETLSEIAERYGVSVQRLMQLNGIKQADLVQTGTRLNLPGGSAPAKGNVTVQPGETLSEIAERHGLSVKRLIELNGIKDPDLVQAGTRLVVPGSNTATRTAATARTSPARTATVSKDAREHVVQPGETLSQIAERYGVPVSQLVSLNDLKEPNHVEAGSRLALREAGNRPATPRTVTPATTKPAAAKPAPAKPVESKPVAAKPAAPKPAPQTAEPEDTPQQPAKPQTTTPTAARPQPAPVATPAPAKVAAATPRPAAPGGANWRTYGPLQVDFANWRPLGGSDVAPALNSAGQPIFVSVNCSAQKINATGEGGAWKTWEPPQTDFEQALVRDACKATAAQAAQRNGQG
jgi:LysM repeat protein